MRRKHEQSVQDDLSMARAHDTHAAAVSERLIPKRVLLPDGGVSSWGTGSTAHARRRGSKDHV